MSGGHVNPAVTVGMLVTGNIKVAKGILYIIVQCLGALAGSGLLKVIISFYFFFCVCLLKISLLAFKSFRNFRRLPNISRNILYFSNSFIFSMVLNLSSQFFGSYFPIF